MHLALMMVACLAGTPDAADKPAPELPPLVLPGCTPAEEIPSVRPRVSVRHDFGDGVGYSSGFTYLEGFVPLLQEPGSWVVFGDGRIVNYDHSRQWETQLGGGGRLLLPGIGAVAGFNAFYDGRNTDIRWLHQFGLGWEALGPVWQARGNVYIPVGPQRFALGGASSTAFVGTNVLLDLRTLTAMTGVDVEAGRQLPSFSEAMRTSAFLGFYSYSHENTRSANGVRARLESWVGENASLHLSVQHDPVFKTTVTGGLGFHLGGVARGARGADPLAARLGDRVVRDPNIVISQQGSKELAIDPATGKPLEVRHVASGAAAGGDGSVERPFRTLPQIQAGSDPGHILFAHAGSVFAGQFIILKPGQRLLGEGVPHSFTARQGTFLLPRATGGTVLPLITTPGSTVAMASATELSGFRISSGGAAVQAVAVNAVNINRNIIEATGNGIILVDVGGNVAIVGNTINRAGFTAISYTAGAATVADLSILGNRITSVDAFIGARGIAVETAGTSRVRAMVNGNEISGLFGALTRGITLAARDSSSLIAQVAANRVSSSGGFLLTDAIRVDSLNSSFVGLQLQSNVGGPLSLFQLGTSRFQAEDVLGSNSVLPTRFGAIQIVPAGMFGFPLP